MADVTRITDRVNIEDSGDNIIDPATEGKQGDIISRVSSEKDIFGYQSVVQPYNQVEMRLDAADYADFTDQTTAGGGSGGSISQSGGLVTIATGTAATGSATLYSVDSVEYRPGVGIYGDGTAVFTTGAAGQTQRVGISSDTSFTNSVTFGCEAGVFGIRYTRGGSEVSFTPQASWDDPCLGASGSRYTRTGTGGEEALDPTMGNLYRIKAGLFGYAGWVAEVWSPCDPKTGRPGWIPVLTYEHVNTSASPVFTSNTFIVILQAKKTSGASSYSIKSQCWAAGTGSALARMAADTLSDRTLAQPVLAAIAGKTTAGGGGYVAVKVSPSGALETNASQDTHDSLNANANIQVGDIDVSNSNPVPVGDAGGSITIDDQYTDGEVLSDQSGADGVLTFTFANPMSLIWVRSDGGDSRADPFGGTPSATLGIICEDGVPNPLTVVATAIKVYAPSGATVNVWGYRYA